MNSTYNGSSFWSVAPVTTLFPNLNSRELKGSLAAQVRPSEFSRDMIESRQQAEALAREQAFSLPAFAANRICPWCSKFCHEDHFVTCAKRLVTCPLCKEYVLATDAVKHYKDCEESIVYIATERIARRFEEQRRVEEEEAERRRVQQLHAQAEADAANLRRRASTMVTKKQSIGSLLFSGLSLGNEGVEVGGEPEVSGSSFPAPTAGMDASTTDSRMVPQQHRQSSAGSILLDGHGGESTITPNMGPKRSMVRILSQPEMQVRSGSIASTSNQPSGGEDTGSAFAGGAAFHQQTHDDPVAPYNRVGSFFQRTNSIRSSAQHEDPMDDAGSQHAVQPSLAPRQSFSASAAIADPLRRASAAPSMAGSAGIGFASSGSFQTAPSLGADNQPQRRHTIASPPRTEGGSSAAPLPANRPPPTLPRSQSSVAAFGAPPPSVNRKIPPPPASAPNAAASIAAPPSGRDAVESPARPVSVSSAASPAALPAGMKRCKWCSATAPIEHEKKCVSRIVQCKKCSSMIKLKDKDEHMRICSSLRGEAASPSP